MLPSEHSCKVHQETWEWREEQKGLAAVKAFVTGEGKAKVKAAEEIIANAKAVKKAITAEAERKMKAADKRTGEAVRKEKVAEKRMQESEAKSNALAEKTALFRERVKQFKGAFANATVMQEQEVQRRLSPVTFPMRQHEEDERYLQRRKATFAAELEQVQEQGKAQQEHTREILEKQNARLQVKEILNDDYRIYKADAYPHYRTTTTQIPSPAEACRQLYIQFRHQCAAA